MASPQDGKFAVKGVEKPFEEPEESKDEAKKGITGKGGKNASKAH